MKKSLFGLLVIVVFITSSAISCQKSVEPDSQPLVNNVKKIDEETNQSTNSNIKEVVTDQVRIIFLHHSTGANIWQGGVADWFANYNSQNGTNYQINEREFPKDSPYGWDNYPYDYWNIWVNHAGAGNYQEEPTLEILTDQYDVIVWKHCFPVSDIEEDIGDPDVASSDKRIENYQLQYNALKAKMQEFFDTKFIVWTGAAQVQEATDPEMASRAKTFFNWVKNDWDETGDNIFIWDFYQLETEGGLYLKNEYAEDSSDSHPNSQFFQTVAPYFGQRIVDVIEGRGDIADKVGH